MHASGMALGLRRRLATVFLLFSTSSSTIAPALRAAFVPLAPCEAARRLTAATSAPFSLPPIRRHISPSRSTVLAPFIPRDTRSGELCHTALLLSGAGDVGEDTPPASTEVPGTDGAIAGESDTEGGKKKRKRNKKPYFDPWTPPPGPEVLAYPLVLTSPRVDAARNRPTLLPPPPTAPSPRPPAEPVTCGLQEFPPYEPTDFFRFELVHQSARSRARVGRIHTPHGVIDTPGFVPVATVAAQKAVDHTVLDAMADQQLMFCNTYHLLLQPGPEVPRRPRPRRAGRAAPRRA